jgi:hypothetical protein
MIKPDLNRRLIHEVVPRRRIRGDSECGGTHHVINGLFIINGENERHNEDQYRIVGTMKDEKVKLKGSTLLGYTRLIGRLEHLKIETRLIDEMFGSVMGEHVFLK